MHSYGMEVTHESNGDAKLTVSDAVKITGLSADTIRRYSNSGKLPTYRTPANHRRFVEEDIRSLIQRGRVA